MTAAESDLMTADETAAMLRVKVKTLTNQRALGEGPPYVRLSRGAIRYSRKALAAWLAEREVTPDRRDRHSAIA